MGENSDVAKGCLFPAAIAALVAGGWWLALVPLHIWHKTGADGHQHPVTATYVAYGIGGGLLLAILMFISIRSAAKRPNVYTSAGGPHRPKPAPPAPPAPPACPHPAAVKVDSIADWHLPYEDRPALAWWCPGCQTQFDPPAFKASELRPDASWPPMRRKMTP